MKKIFSMMLLTAAVMVTAFTSCSKSDDNDPIEEENVAYKLAGTFTGKMHYYFEDHDLGTKDVTFIVAAEGKKNVSITIPEINDLAFKSILGGQEIDVKVKKFASYTISGVNAVAFGDVVSWASKFTSAEELMKISGEFTLSQHLDTFGFSYKDIEIGDFDMEIMGMQRKGKTTVSGEVVFEKYVGRMSLTYRFSPVPGVVIIGSLDHTN